MKYNPKHLPEDTRVYLENIIDREVESLSTEDILFLRARRDYLNAEQTEKFESVLKVDEKAEAKEVKEAEKTEEKAQKEDWNELKAKAKELGINIKGKSREEIEVEISTIVGPSA